MNFKNKFIPIVITGTLLVPLIEVEEMGQAMAEKGRQTISTDVDEDVLKDVVARQVDELGDGNIIVTLKANNEYQLTAYENDVQVEDRDGWKAIDTTLTPDGEGGFVTKETKLDIKFSEELDPKDSFIEVGDNRNQKVEFSLTGIETDKGVKPLQRSDGEVSDNVITYPDIMDGVDLRHIVLNSEVKEDVILHKPVKGLKSINYKLKTSLIPTLDDTGDLVLSDKHGNKIYEMPAPQMSDSEVALGSGYSELNHDIEYRLTKKSDHYEIKLIPTSDWLDQDRTYPVYIDPTLVKNASLDTFVSSAAPDKGHNQYWNSTLGQYVLRVGKYDSSTGTNYALVKLYSLDNLVGADITSANLKTFVNWSYYETTKTGLWVDKVASSWSENNVTWNTRPASTGIASTTVARNSWATFNVTNAVKEVVSGKRVDYGFKFHTNGNEMTHWKQLSAGENGKNVTNLSITYSYPQMQAIKSNPFPTGAGATTGYIDLSWPSIKGATGYRLQMFDGKGWQTIYNGTATSFTTKDKKIWPLSTQYNVRDSGSGGIKFRTGDGQELPMNPSPMYSTSSGVATSSKAFQFRAIADYKLGSSNPSVVTKPVLDGIIPDTPSAPVVKETGLDETDENGYFTVEWDEVEGATSYDLQIFNGNNYENIPVGNTTQWTSENKSIYPSPTQLENVKVGDTNVFRLNNDGVNLGKDPRKLYRLSGTKYANTTYYFVKVVAKSSKGTSSPSPFTRVWLPTSTLTTNHTGVNVDDDKAYIQSRWEADEEAAGYLVSMYNGKEYQIVSRLPKDVSRWTSKDKKIWPLDNQGIDLRTTGDGRELLVDPSVTYKKSDRDSSDSNYRIKIQSYRAENTALSPYDYSRYHGLSSDEAVDDVSIFDKPIPRITLEEEVVADRPKMVAPEVEAFTNGDGTGYLDVSWAPVVGAKKYQVFLFNGHQHATWDVPVTSTSWTTKGKKIYPTLEQLDDGRVDYLKDGTGQELADEPSYLYTKSWEIANGIDYRNSNNYYVYVRASLEDGYSPVSDATVATIPMSEQMTFLNDGPLTDIEDKVDQHLLEKGFDAETLNEMPLDLKQEILQDQGTYVDSQTTGVEFSGPVSEEDDSTIVLEGESFDDFKNPSPAEGNTFSTMSIASSDLGDSKTWDKTVNSFRGKTYVTYIGETSKEFRYMLYSAFRWDKKPWHSYTKDQFGLTFQERGTLVASNRGSGMTVRSTYKKEYNYTLPYETSSLNSSKFLLDWKKFPNVQLDYALGHGKVEVRYSKTHRGKPASIIGYYYHPWYSPSGSVSLGPVSVDFPFPKSDKWKWNDEFTIGAKK